MPLSAEKMDALVGQAAAAAGLSGPAELEAHEEQYRAWAEAPHPDLGGHSPQHYAAALSPEDLLTAFDDSATLRGTSAARVWLDEVVARMRRELTQAGPDPLAELDRLPVLAAITDRSQLQPESELENVGIPVSALTALGRLEAPEVMPWLLAGLATDDRTLRAAAAAAAGAVGLPALPAIRAALQHTRDPYLKEGLYMALGALPPAPPVREALQQAWQNAAAPERIQLAQAMGRHGDPDLAPLLSAELTAGPTTRAAYAALAAALHRLGSPRPEAPAPPPQPSDPEADLLAGVQTLAEAGLTDLARQWVQEGVARLEQAELERPEEVDWFIYEQMQRLADDLLQRPAEAPLHRYLDYCYGALHYYGALPLDQLMAAVSLAGLMAPPQAGDLWQALKQDHRFALHPEEVVALPEVERVETIVEHREDLAIGPALIPLRAMALAARGLHHLAWTPEEEDAAHELLHRLPESLAEPERVAELQRAMRGQPEALAAFRHWLGEAVDQGMDLDRPLREAMVKLWNQTARWELFGHTPAALEQIVDLRRAQEGDDGSEDESEAALDPGSTDDPLQ